MHYFETEHGRLIVTAVDGKLTCFSAKCPHASADLSEDGAVSGRRVVCPKHGWKFDVLTGRALYPPDEACRLKMFPVEDVNGKLVLVLP